MAARLVVPIGRTERKVLQLRERGRADGWRALIGDEGLVHIEVALAEVDRFRSLRGDRDLLHREVEVLGPRREGLVERNSQPLHLVLGEAELLGQGVCERGLVALTRVRVTCEPAGFPFGSVDALAPVPGRVGRVAGRDRQGAVVHERCVGGAARGVDRSGFRRGSRIGRLGRPFVFRRARGGNDRQHRQPEQELPHHASPWFGCRWGRAAEAASRPEPGA